MISEYEPLEVIGRGSYGIVRKVRRILDDYILVRKEIEYNSMNSHERNQLILELKILRGLNHANIVKYYAHDHIAESHMIHIYMEYCDSGDVALVISNFKKNRDTVPEEFVWEVLVQILLALHRCHYGTDAAPVDLFLGRDKDEPTINDETVVIHRDIKPDNIFLSSNRSIVKLGDFGLAKMLTLKHDFAKTYVGTPYYMLPEVLMDQPYSPLCDIWLLGCVLYELCTLEPPFKATSHIQLQEKIKNGIFKPVPESYSLQLRTIIHDCITVDIDYRPLVHVLLENLAVKFLRKELELKERIEALKEYQSQLSHKAETLKQKETYLEQWESKIETQKDDLNKQYSTLQKKFNVERQRVEDELMEEFSARKKVMDQEAKDVRLGYAREFKLVVEQEVQLRVKEILKRSSNKPLQNQPQRDPLKMRNELPKEFKPPPIPMQQQSRTMPDNVYRSRISDAFERVTMENRNTPEFEEVQLRKNYRNFA